MRTALPWASGAEAVARRTDPGYRACWTSTFTVGLSTGSTVVIHALTIVPELGT